MNKLNKALSSLLFVLVYLLYQSFLPNKTSVPSTHTPKPSLVSSGLIKVIRVVDGDTIEIEGNIKVRYIGINAPESVAPGKPVGCFGHEASDKNKELVLGEEVTLEKDISETDKYNRLLRYVYLDGVMINDELVKEGYAEVATYPPDIKYKDEFLVSEKYAKENSLGLWGKCGN